VLKRILFRACLFSSVLLLHAAQAGRTDSKTADFKIDGRLMDAVSGQPVAHARVAIATATERDAFTTMITAEDGLFFFAGLKPGKYSLTAQAHGYAIQSFNQHDQYSSAVVVGENLNSSGLVFRVGKENTIDGTITDEAGEPVRGAQITLYQTGTVGGSQGTRARAHVMTNDEGNYHIGHLPPGDYIIAVIAQVWYARRPAPRRIFYSPQTGKNDAFSFGSNMNADTASANNMAEEQPGPLDVAYPITFFPGVTEPAAAAVVHLTRGEKYVASFNVQPVRALHLKIPVPVGQENLMSFALQQQMFDGTVIPVPTRSTRLPSGEFEIEGIAPGHYTLTSTTYIPPEPGARRVAAAQSASTAEIDALGNGVIESSKPTSAVSLKAKLIFDPGASVTSRSSLQLSDFKTRRNFLERIPENGEVQFRQNIPPGSYEISINGGGGVGSFIRSITSIGARTYGRTLVIKSAATVTLQIMIGKGQGQITGVALRDGQPLAGVMIVAVPSDPAHNQVLFRRDQSDSDGTFILPAVVPGDYTVLAFDIGWDLQWLKPEVLKPYLAQGETIQVKQNGKYELKLKVQ
jgi:protocatechuate 3,4-dioxygenase beta subunit